MITLTDHERDKFATYLEQEAANNDQMAKTAENAKIFPKEMIKKLRLEALASKHVANKLRSWESQTIEGDPQ